ncbi:MAG: M20 family metallopeptidase [Bacillota bacterium]|nr:M20 family metallopeptidase [Bacillota bacterium]
MSQLIKQQWSESVDQAYMQSIYRELHQYPELAFDLPRTLSLVRRELDRFKIPYTEQYGQSSIVATINEENNDFTIGIRADMDALAITEQNDVSYKSRINGQMHACGHDAHTAVLLGTAKALQQLKDTLSCRVRLLFQPSEEGVESGAYLMVEGGVMDGIDSVIALHVDTTLETGTVGVCPGLSQAASRTFRIRFTGRPSHTSQPHKGSDALAMAVKTYNELQLVLSRELNPLESYFCSFNKLTAGTTQNVTAASAEMLGTARTLSVAVDRHILKRIGQIARQAADATGGTAEIWTSLKCLPVYNDLILSDSWRKSAVKVVGAEQVKTVPLRLSSEDFSQYLRKTPGLLFRLGVVNRIKHATGEPHNSNFLIDDDALSVGCAVFVQFVLDQMHSRTASAVQPDMEKWLE